MATNGFTSSQTIFKVGRDAEGLSVRTSTLDLIEGRLVRTTRGREVEVRHANYMQDRGVSAGEASFTVQVRTFYGARVESLRIFSDSGLELTPLGPGRMMLDVHAPRGVRRGTTFAIRFLLRRVGGRSLRQVTLTPDVSQCDNARLLGPRRGAWDVVSRSAAERFHMRAERRGPCLVSLYAGSASSGQQAEALIRVLP
ncbi:MAG: hypothetical protein ABR583_02005 [Gaiellaceae bacterium]